MFYNTDFLRNDEIYLKLISTREANPQMQFVPAYVFNICNSQTGEVMGFIDLRIGYNENVYYGGNIGYTVNERFRGNHYAGKACLLLFELAKLHGMTLLIITCNPENIASRRTCEYIGCEFDKIVDLPPHNDMYKDGERRKCIYRINI